MTLVLDVVWSMPDKRTAHMVESLIHKQLDGHSLNGEWYFCDRVGALCEIDGVLCDYAASFGDEIETKRLLTEWGYSADHAADLVVQAS